MKSIADASSGLFLDVPLNDLSVELSSIGTFH
jgi:hypothetical protein